MIFEEYVKENRKQFVEKVADVSSFLMIDPGHLMFLMWFETIKTLDHRIQSKFTKATGLIQFMPKTAIFLGTTIDKLIAMSNVEQMDYVQKHLGIFRGQYKDYVDLYCGIFWPAAVGKPDSFRITSDIVARQNPIFDQNKDLDIEKGEIRCTLLKQIPLKYRGYFNGKTYKDQTYVQN